MRLILLLIALLSLKIANIGVKIFGWEAKYHCTPGGLIYLVGIKIAQSAKHFLPADMIEELEPGEHQVTFRE